MKPLDALRARIEEDAELAQRLRRIDSERFVDEVVAVAAELRCDVTRSELEAAIYQGGQTWGLRWIR